MRGCGVSSGEVLYSFGLRDRVRHPLLAGPDATFAGKLTFWLQQSQLAGTCDRFSAPLDLEFVKDFPVVPLDCV